MTYRRKIIIGILVLALLGILAAAFWPEKPEPVYKGRKLSEWVEGGPTLEMGFREAVEAVGTNGIPLYLEWINYRPSFLKSVQFELAAQTRKWLHVQWETEGKRLYRELVAGMVLQQLGERAAPAIPQLVAYCTNGADGNSRSRRVAFSSMSLLKTMGQPGASAILSLMTNENPKVRGLAIMQAMNWSEPTVIAQMKRSIADVDPWVREVATNATARYESGVAVQVGKP
jgi:hypothetical protein